jgi:hypothetical protein
MLLFTLVVYSLKNIQNKNVYIINLVLGTCIVSENHIAIYCNVSGKTRCAVNATNAPALSQSFKAMFNFFQFQGG